MTLKKGNSPLCSSFPARSFPATEALKQAEEEMKVARAEKRTTSFDDSLSSAILNMRLIEDTSAFPIIEWDLYGGYDSSESMRSLDRRNPFLSDDSSRSSLGKRGRDHESRSSKRLVRSKNIQSNLASLALSIVNS